MNSNKILNYTLLRSISPIFKRFRYPLPMWKNRERLLKNKNNVEEAKELSREKKWPCDGSSTSPCTISSLP